MDAARCPNGHENPPGQTFCGECGTAVESTAETNVPQPPIAFASSSTFEASGPPQAKRKPNPLLIVGAGVAVLIVGLLGWLVLSSRGGTAGPLAETHTITGSLTASECGGGYNIANTSVEIRDEKDKLIGAGTTTGNSSSGGGCTVSWSIPDVPKASFYQVTIGTHGGPSYSYADMKTADWALDLTL
jgi:hypothetical protein